MGMEEALHVRNECLFSPLLYSNVAPLLWRMKPKFLVPKMCTWNCMSCHAICAPRGRATASSTGREELPVSLFTRKEEAAHGFICPVISPGEASASIKVQRFVLCRWIVLARWHGTPLTGILSLFFPSSKEICFFYFQFLCHCFTL